MSADIEARDGVPPPAGAAQLEQHARALLLASAEHLPGAVRSRLTRARHAALEVHPARLRYRMRRWAPAGAALAAAVMLLVVFMPHGVRGPANAISASVDDIDLLTSDMPLTMHDNDYQFYEWAVDEASAAGSGAASADGT